MIFPDSLLTPSEFKFGATSRESRIGFLWEEHRLLRPLRLGLGTEVV